jgi:hypothetical protein
MLKYRRLARAHLYQSRSQLARYLKEGVYSPLAAAQYRHALEYLSLALHAFDKADRLNQHKDQHQGGRSA